MPRITIFASIDKESLSAAGIVAKLPEEAIDFLMHFNEVPLILDVDGENGAVCGCQIAPAFIDAIKK